MKGILIVDHGSTKHEANHMLQSMADLIQSMAGLRRLVRYAHMELAEPDIADRIRALRRSRRDRRHRVSLHAFAGQAFDVGHPRMVAEVARRYPQVSFSVTPAFGLHEKLAEVVLERAGVGVRAD